MLNEDYKEMLQILLEENVKFIVVGAYALGAYGFPRATGDIDIWIESTAVNAKKLIRSLARFGAPLFDVNENAFTEEGIIPSHCNECGICSDCKEGTLKLKRIEREKCSNHNIKKGLKMLCNRQKNFSYNIYKSILKFLKAKEINTTDVLVSLASYKFKEFGVNLDEDVIRSTFALVNT